MFSFLSVYIILFLALFLSTLLGTICCCLETPNCDKLLEMEINDDMAGKGIQNYGLACTEGLINPLMMHELV